MAGRRKIVTQDLPYSVAEIISSSIQDLEVMRANLTVEQYDRVKKIRQRGKNSLAARNSRKRKTDEVDELRVKLNKARELGKEIVEKEAKMLVLRDELSERMTREVDRVLVSHDLDPQTHTIEFEGTGDCKIVEVWDKIKKA